MGSPKGFLQKLREGDCLIKAPEQHDRGPRNSTPCAPSPDRGKSIGLHRVCFMAHPCPAGVDGTRSLKAQNAAVQLFFGHSCHLFLWPSFFRLCLSAGGQKFADLQDCGAASSSHAGDSLVLPLLLSQAFPEEMETEFPMNWLMFFLPQTTPPSLAV